MERIYFDANATVPPLRSDGAVQRGLAEPGATHQHPPRRAEGPGPAGGGPAAIAEGSGGTQKLVFCASATEALYC